MNPEVIKDIGKDLKQHRIAANITLDNVSKSLKIRKSYIKSIEDGKTENMIFEAYLIGYIRHYARYLNLDPEQYVQQLKGTEIDLKTMGSDDVITEEEFLPSIRLLLFTIAITLLSFLCVVYY